MKKSDLLIFTDLDGTLLDHNTYSHEAARESLERVSQLGIATVFCSSKTRGEIQLWRRRLNNEDPFIAENGGGIFFPSSFHLRGGTHKQTSGYSVIELGVPHDELLAGYRVLKEIFRNKIIGFSEMSVQDIIDLTGLPQEEAFLSKVREYTEPFTFSGDEEDERKLRSTVRNLNLNLTKGGRFFCLLVGNDKGKAVKIVTNVYNENTCTKKTLAFGDSLNDLPMLKAVDIPVLVQKPGGSYDSHINLPNLIYAPGVGPVGFNITLLSIINNMGRF